MSVIHLVLWRALQNSVFELPSNLCSNQDQQDHSEKEKASLSHYQLRHLKSHSFSHLMFHCKKWQYIIIAILLFACTTGDKRYPAPEVQRSQPGL
jgi:hypothetical protein